MMGRVRSLGGVSAQLQQAVQAAQFTGESEVDSFKGGIARYKAGIEECVPAEGHEGEPWRIPTSFRHA